MQILKSFYTHSRWRSSFGRDHHHSAVRDVQQNSTSSEVHSMRARRRSIKATVISAVMVSSLLTVAIPAFGSANDAPAKTMTPLQRGKAFYKGQTISIVAPDQAGSSIDIELLDLAPYLQQYLGAAGINVTANGAGDGYPAMDAFAKAPADGLSLGVLNLGSVISAALTNTPGANFNPADEQFLAGLAPSDEMLIASPSSPYKTFAEIKASTTPIRTLVTASGSTNTEIRTIFGILHVNAQFVSGFSGTGPLVQGYESGDGPLTFMGLATWGPLIQGGQAVPIMVLNHPPVGVRYRSLISNTPTISQIFKKYPVKSKHDQTVEKVILDFFNLDQIVSAQPRVASYKVLAVREAFKYAFAQQAFKNEMLAIGNSPSLIAPSVEKQQYLTIEREGAPLACYIEGSC